MLTFHSPDGSVFFVERDAVKAVKPVAGKHHDHLPAPTRSVVYLGVQSGFGISETVAEVLDLMKHCNDAVGAPPKK